MRKSLLPLCLLLAFLCSCSNLKAQAVNTGDSLALVDLYNSTNGPGWVYNSNWRTVLPVSAWYGVFVENGRVVNLQLQRNRLTGSLTTSFGNLTELTRIDLSYNEITGGIPASIGNISGIISRCKPQLIKRSCAFHVE